MTGLSIRKIILASFLLNNSLVKLCCLQTVYEYEVKLIKLKYKNNKRDRFHTIAVSYLPKPN